MTTTNSALGERDCFSPTEDFIRQANISGADAYAKIRKYASENHEEYWAGVARELISWHKPFTKTLDQSNAPFFKWFEDGQLNASYNSIDRHLPAKTNQTAIIFEADGGEVSHITYQELHDRVCQLANGLKGLGVKKGDRVVIYLQMGVEIVVAMQACARIGAIHSVVFAGFSAKSIADRIADASAKIVITANEGVRGGKKTPLKSAVDEALQDKTCDSVEQVIVFKRTDTPSAWLENRNIWWHDLVATQPKTCEPEWMGAEDPLFILYTSGSTGQPKGVVHATAGYLTSAYNGYRWVLDYRAGDISFCTADIGWITGHSYCCYAPLGFGATFVIFEGIPTYPTADRLWEMIERHKVTIFYTAPTAIRSLIKLGAELPRKHDLSSLRLLGTAGEPINPDAWYWYHKEVGREVCPIVDTWWQTETGAMVITPIPGAVPTKPGSCTLPLPGMDVDVVDETGASVAAGTSGFLVIKKPFPSLARTIWNNDKRYKDTYFPEDFKGEYYLAGDSASKDNDGYIWIMGRVDDVLNVSGHRLGTMEVESVLAAHPLVAEAAVVGRPHEVKGESIVAFVVLKDERPKDAASAAILAKELKDWVASQIGKVAQPEDIRFGDNLPKTRSGKIMRRLLRSIAKGEEITQDTSTLENPQVLDQLKEAVL